MLEDNQRLLQAVRVANIGIFDHDHDSGTIDWSLELRQIYGWDLEEPATLPKILGHVHPEDIARVVAAVGNSHDPQGNGLFDIEHRIIDRRGEVRWVVTRSQTHFELAEGPPRARRTIGAVLDVTERRKADHQLRALDSVLMHAQKMESIGRLAGGVAHDFNNLLAVISGGIEVSLSALPADHPSRACLRDAADAARSAVVLTRQLLAFSRKEAIAPRLLDLKEIITRMERIILRLLDENIELEIRCGADHVPIWFDPAQIEQVILNLAINARDAMTRGGRLTISVSNVSNVPNRAAAAPGTYALLTVSDNGVGMTAEVRAQLFEPFFTTKEAGKGTGLGLALVYGAVQQNGGQIEVESEPGRGSSFKIYLPAGSGADAASRAPIAAT